MEMSTTKRVLLLLYPGWYFHYKKGGHIIVTGAQLLLVYSIVDMTIIIISFPWKFPTIYITDILLMMFF